MISHFLCFLTGISGESVCMKPLLIFDLDGTLYQIDKAWIPAVQQTCTEFGARAFADEVFRDRIGLRSDKMIEWYESFLPEGKLDDFLEVLRERTFERMADAEFLYPDCQETLQKLKEESGAMVICSNGTSPYVELVLESYQIRSLFDDVYTAGDHKYTKEECVAEILVKYPERPAFLIGDRAQDARAAKVNGISCIGASYGYGSGEELSEADILIDRLSDLPAALQKFNKR